MERVKNKPTASGGRHRATLPPAPQARIWARLAVTVTVVAGLLAVGAPAATAAPASVTVPGCAGTTSNPSGTVVNPTPAGGFVLTGAQYSDYLADKAVPLYYSTGTRIANADGTYTERAGQVPFCGVQKTETGPASAWRYCTDEGRVNCLANPPSRLNAPNSKFDNNQAALSVIAYLINTRDQSTKRARARLQAQIWCISENIAPEGLATAAKNYFNGNQFDGTAAGGPESAKLTDGDVTCDSAVERDKAVAAVPATATLALTAAPSTVNAGETARFDLETNYAVGNVKLKFEGASTWGICAGEANGATLSGDVLTLTKTGRVRFCATRQDGGTLTLEATGHALDRNSLNWFHNKDDGCQVYTSVADYQTLTTKRAGVVVNAPTVGGGQTEAGNGQSGNGQTGAGSGAAASAALAKPTVRTVASAQQTGVGAKIHDTVIVTGLPDGASVTATAQLFGPKNREGSIRCDGAAYATVPLQITGNGTFVTPAVQVDAPGWYSWQVTLAAGPTSQSATEGCAQAEETVLVSRPTVAAVTIPTGFNGVVDGPLARLMTRPSGDSITIKGSRIKANLQTVGAKGKTLSVPKNVANVGWYGATARFSDVIGSAVVAGHVSDRNDSPGAFYRLKKVRAGDVITVRKAGVTYRYKVTGKRTYSRAKGLPKSLFSTTGPAQLNLVTCAGRKASNGHFHYTQNLVVTAIPIS